MKFGLKHRTDILKILQQYQISESQVDFIKRRGRIHVVFKENNKSFSYFRKKETRLDALTHQWKHQEYYEVKADNTLEKNIPSWQGVLEMFNNWCRKLG